MQEYLKLTIKKKGTKKHYTLYIKLYLHIECQLISTKVIENNLSNDSTCKLSRSLIKIRDPLIQLPQTQS